jgi:ATP-dependent Clp protease ATP-binding subunit ClpC
MYKFNGFTEKANRAINLAIAAAESMGHTYVGSEHILLGLLENRDGVGYAALEQCGADAEKLKEIIEEQIGVGEKTRLTPEDFTPRSKRVLQNALMKASGMSCKYVGTEHLLVALLSDSDSYAVRFLEEMNVRIQDIVESLNELLGSTGDGTDRIEDSGRASGGSRAKGSATKTLDKYGRDLTEAARKGEIDPVIGRQEEIERVVQILSRRTKNNPCLIGEPGVGKTAVAEGLALKIVEGNVPEPLKDKRIVSLDLTSMVAGAKYRGDFEDRISATIDEVKKAGNVILFIDELHTIIGSGSAEGSADAANILKPTLARGDFQVIGATTINEYRKYIEKDAALERRFQPVMVGEPTEEEAVQILKGLRDRYEAHHKVRITDEAILAAVKLSSRYIADRFLPDKAIDLIDEAASRVRLRAYTAPDDLQESENRLKAIEQEKAEAVNTQDFETAARLRDEEKKLREDLENRRKAWQEKNAVRDGEVTPEDIAQIVSGWTGVPVVQLTEEESTRLLHLEEELHRRIIGQDEAVSAVSRAIRRGRVGLKDPKRPVGSFIFLGPTGVGKTELCKALAQAMFGDENAIVRFDMSEYMEKHTVSKLIGSPPGYVGYDEGGQLTEAVRRHPYSVLLFDEIEKAHPDVFNMLLQILDEGRLTDSQGRHVNFRNTVIIMTSNVGARLITEKQASLGFFGGEEKAQQDDEKIREAVLAELKKVFKPEFLNRVDDTIVFHKLTEEDICRIAENLLAALKQRLKELDIEAEFTPEAVKAVAKAGYDEIYGARPLKRAIQTKIEDPISEKLLDGTVQSGNKLTCDYADGKFTFSV